MGTSSDRAPAFQAHDPAPPEWSQDQAVKYEVAREAITALMAFRSQWIFDEEGSAAPDLAAIESWRAERAAFAAELRSLDVRDQKTLARICELYGPEIRRLDALELQRERRDR
ncbi:MAG TPA: hypothetical protein VJV78_32385 [Polyangiales bacterium]|nr:hypothetical protein [Polyangiales bacterium]